MNEELNIKELLAELKVYRWRDEKAVILKELGLTRYLTTYNRAEIINAYEANRPFSLIKRFKTTNTLYVYLELFINKEVDDLLSKGYTVDEIIKAVREWVKKRKRRIK